MAATDDASFHRSLLSSIYDYIQRRGLKKTAKYLSKETNAAGMPLETSRCNLEDLWKSFQRVGDENLKLETTKAGVQNNTKTTQSQDLASGRKKEVPETSSSSDSTTESKQGESSSSSTETSSASSSEVSDSSGKYTSSRSASQTSSSSKEKSESSSSSQSSSSTEYSSGSSSERPSSVEESGSSSSSAASSSTSESGESSGATEQSSSSSESEGSTETSEHSKSDISSSASSSSSAPESSDTENSSSRGSSSSSATGSVSSSSTSDSDSVQEITSKTTEEKGIISSKRQREESQGLGNGLQYSQRSSGSDIDSTARPLQKKHRTNPSHDFREDALISSTSRNDDRQDTEIVSHKSNSETLKESSTGTTDKDSSTLRRFQRIHPESVKFVDERLRDNSYDAKGGEIYGLKAWEELKKVRGKDFRKAKTKKKKATYFGGGTISKDSHSFHFTYSDESN